MLTSIEREGERGGADGSWWARVEEPGEWVGGGGVDIMVAEGWSGEGR